MPLFPLHRIAAALLAALVPAAHAGVELIAVGQLSGAGSDLSGLSAPLENGVPGDVLGGLGSGLAWAGGNVFLSLPDSTAVEAVVLGERGLLASARAGQVVVDLSTAAPASTVRICAALAERDVAFVDAGISGGAAAAMKRTFCGKPLRSASLALTRVDITMGAPHRWVTPCVAKASKIAPARTQRRQTWVPATADSDQGMHQPLQWNIGRVQR